VAELVRDLDGHAVDAGLLTAARYVEPAMMLLISLAYAGAPRDLASRLLERRSPNPRVETTPRESDIRAAIDTYQAARHRKHRKELSERDRARRTPLAEASFVGIERVTGRIAERRGSFLLQDAGTLEGNLVQGDWFVIPGSGTGEPAGLRGEGGFAAELGQHASITLDYWLE
jgi:hypothetical protein